MAVEQENDSELKSLIEPGKDSLKFSRLPIPGSTKFMYCNVDGTNIRPYVPVNHRDIVMRKLHNLAHPSIRATRKLVSERYVWPALAKDVAEFVRGCLQCQKVKSNKYTSAPLSNYDVTDKRFQHINIDLIGPLPTSGGNRYCLTCIDRFSRWPTAIPIPDISAHTVALAFISGWVASYGVPECITTDLGKQFQSSLFKELTTILGIRHLRTTAYHPQANGMIERWHRTLKNAIKCYASKDWSFILPLVLLGLRTTVKLDIGVSPAELLYGTQLRLPGEFWSESKSKVSQTEFVQQLRRAMADLRCPKTSWHTTKDHYVDPDLNSCKFVFVRVDRVRKPLEAAFEGPFEVEKRYKKYFVIKRGNSKDKVTVDRIKPAKTYRCDVQEPRKESQDNQETEGMEPPLKVTRYGRRVKFPNFSN
ncbi:Retrovirus-related Pol polyprotein from transposon 412 [Eumeta japonica]|uniref:Retrovirus-related Pol polyprotein from transposon 412 n=1 Tax=Eumeta variegata TaxID=151549 RepID=A0A4C1TTL4_EUMVA|nr:Retrovirus-related Pol polyprotein from transposon 412 [Eumeta japonica]